MSIAARIFAISEFARPSDGEPIRSVCLKLKSPQSLFGMFVQGKKLPLTFIPTVKTLGLFFLVLPVTTKEAVWLPSSRPEKLP
ncbi:Uncharacterised protein [Klebsiella pneumoniae]|nr:Uncharacterised protein [Klebsiella pneumoniae]